MSDVNDIQWFQDQKDHILLRPDMYVCSVSKCEDTEYVYDNGTISLKKIVYTPALVTIFKEVLDNARDAKINDPTVTQIKVTIEDDIISVWNNGKGILIEKHEKYGLLGPEIVFGKLNSGTNYDDNKERLTGGLNGLGVKLTNIFSSFFQVECADGKRKFLQTYTDNMGKRTEPIVSNSSVSPYVKISFRPDWKRFGFENMTKDVRDLFSTFTVFTAANVKSGVSVYLNGKIIPAKTFEKFMDLFIGSSKKESPRVCFEQNDWNIGIAISSDGYKQVSFTNGIYNKNGGTHTKYVTNQVVKLIKETLEKKRDFKDIKISNSFIEQHLFVFVSASVLRPSFDSQPKNALVTKSTQFKIKVPEDLIASFVKKTNISEVVHDLASYKSKKIISKTLDSTVKKQKIDVEKLEDANFAGTKKSKDCMLFVVEGDSAKTFVMNAFSVIGRDYYGVYPLRGKVLNVRGKSEVSVSANKEIKALFKILNLKVGEKYTNLNDLRYGKVCCLTDADVDGFHIKGLLMNFIYFYWPELFNLGFVWTFTTPIVKATKGNKEKKQQKCFSTIPEYDEWRKKEKTKGWKIKYYKGLGSSVASEARDCFKKSDDNLTRYIEDQYSDAFMKLAFDKGMADDRKKWLGRYDKETQFIKTIQKEMNLSTFVHKELILFSIEDNERSIPNMMDGLKPGQRKIIWTALNIPKFNVDNEIKVISLGGNIIEKMAYHHGDSSAYQTIISLAQDYVGSNNVNLLVPSGDFGNRLVGGKNAASSRYIFTYLNPIAKKIFREEDDKLLDLLEDDGKPIEPEYLVPIIPMVLVNGSSGIGTGFSTNIPSYNPKDIIMNVVKYLKKEEMNPMVPWYKGFTGEVCGDGVNFKSRGICSEKNVNNKKRFVITELPIGRWTDTYTEYLKKMELEGKLEIIKGNASVENIHIEVETDDIEILKLESKSTQEMLSTTNMYLFDENCKIKKYNSPLEIIEDFCKVRMKFYEKRKKYMVKTLEDELPILLEKRMFVKMVVNDELIIFKRKKADIVLDMKQFKFVDELLAMAIHLFTNEKIVELENKYKKIENELEIIRGKSCKSMWIDDLKELMNILN